MSLCHCQIFIINCTCSMPATHMYQIYTSKRVYGSNFRIFQTVFYLTWKKQTWHFKLSLLYKSLIQVVKARIIKPESNRGHKSIVKRYCLLIASISLKTTAKNEVLSTALLIRSTKPSKPTIPICNMYNLMFSIWNEYSND